MHWVWATHLDGSKVLINLAMAVQMLRVEQAFQTQPMPHTNVIWAILIPVQGGGTVSGCVAVRETPEELLKLPRVAANAPGLSVVNLS